MRRTLHSLFVIFAFVLIEATSVYGQAIIETGSMGISVNDYGRIRVYTPSYSAGTKQIERISALVGTGQDAVYDYQNDADSEDPSVLVSSPQSSDFEIYGAYNNAYSGAPPDVLVKYNIYSWNNAEYFLLKMTIQNRESASINAKIGLDIIPILDGAYGFDTVSYDATNKVIRSHRGGINIGYKLLSQSLTSLVSFEWYDGYEVDANYWGWLNHGSIEQTYISNTADGPVIIPSQDLQTLANSESTIIYYAVAAGSNEANMLTNMQMVEQKYNSITAVDDHQVAPTNYALDQNYPNPFNPSTKISYQIPESGFVTLKVYNAIGKEVATLVNEDKSAGRYDVNFNAADLSSGVYLYTIQSGSFLQTKKMILIK